MNKKNNHALVRKPSSAVKKAAPGTKRIVSGMVVDTLALTKTKRTFVTLIGHKGGIGDIIELIIQSKLEKRFTLKFFRFGYDGGFYLGENNRYANELIALTQQQPFDLIIAYCNMPAEERKLFNQLKIHYGKPIIITSGLATNEMAKQLELMEIAFLPAPFTSEDFWNVLQASLSGMENGK